MEAPDFWDNAEVSQMKMKQLKSLKDDIETYHNLETQMEDMETMIEMGYEENDPEIILRSRKCWTNSRQALTASV